MRRLLSAEVLKLRSLRSTWGYVVLTLGLAGLVISANIGGESAGGRLEEDYQYRIVLDAAFATGFLFYAVTIATSLPGAVILLWRSLRPAWVRTRRV